MSPAVASARRTARAASHHEELANALTHGAGLAASLVGLPLLVLAGPARGDRLQVIGASIFGATLVALYAASTLYHATRVPHVKRFFQLMDHLAIYLLIAGTYTPFTLGVLRGAWGWTMLGVIWSLAAVGIVFKLVVRTRWKRLSTFLYVGMGWVAVVAIEPLAARLAAPGLWLLVAGGVCYTAGTWFYLRDHRRFHHAVWHCFVLAGSACHFVAVLRYAAGGPATG